MLGVSGGVGELPQRDGGAGEGRAAQLQGQGHREQDGQYPEFTLVRQSFYVHFAWQF